MRKLSVKQIIIIVTSLVFFVGLMAYVVISSNSGNYSGNKLQVVSSFYPMYYFASEIGGDKADVKNLTPVGAEPHEYEPSARDIVQIENSDMLILNGGIEPWAEEIRPELDQTLTVVAGGDVGKDPHIWLSPVLAKNEVNEILVGFKQADPDNSYYYQTNADRLLAKLDSLDAKYKTGLATCKKQSFVTSHIAFAHLAGQYSLNQVAISGVSPEEEPSARKLVEVANFVREKQINYIFFESLVSPKFAETIASETGARTLVLDPLEGISNEDMEKGVNYFTVMEANLDNLQIALECRQ